MKIGHKCNVKITNYDKKGRGIAKITINDQEKDALIPFSIKNEEIEANFVRRSKGKKICKINQITKTSPDRIEPKCSHAGKCGGCSWQHLKYETQLKELNNQISDFFKSLSLDKKLQPIIPASEIFHYRNRMDYCVGWNGEIGLKEAGSWKHYVDIQNCHLIQPNIEQILQTVRDWMKDFDIQPWDNKFYTGHLRYVVIRDAQNQQQRMIILVVKDIKEISQEARTAIQEKLLKINKISPNIPITSILLGHQPKTTDISLSEKFESLYGPTYLTETINQTNYKIHPNSFFQTNTKMAEKLQSEVLNIIKKIQPNNVLDLYCGLGFFSITIAQQFKNIKKVWGYELDEEAIKLANENATNNQVKDKCEFFAEKAEELSWQDISAETLILDPPRSGLHPKVIKSILDPETKLNPKNIIYVSCNYRRLEDELPQFLEKYTVRSIQPLDLFPQTPHIEVVLHLELKK